MTHVSLLTIIPHEALFGHSQTLFMGNVVPETNAKNHHLCEKSGSATISINVHGSILSIKKNEWTQ